MTLTFSPRHFVHAIFASFLSVYIAFLPLLSPPDFSAWKRSKTFVTAGFGVDAAGNPVGDFKGIGNEILGGMELNPSGIGGSKYFSEKWLVTSAVNAGVSSAASSAIYGTDFGDALTSSLTGAFVDELTDFGFNLAGDLKADLGLADGSIGAVLAHSTIGCASASISGAECWQGAVTAGFTEGVSSYLSTGFTNDPSKSPAENEALRKAHEQKMAAIIGIGVGVFVSQGDAGYLGISSGLSVSAVKNNRQLHIKEADLIREYADDYAREKGISVEEATQELTEQALRMVDAEWASRVDENNEARKFLVELAKAEANFIVDTYTTNQQFADQNQVYFNYNGMDSSFDYSLVNLEMVHNNSDLYAGLPGTQLPSFYGEGTNIDYFIKTTLENHFSTLDGDVMVTPDQYIEIIDAYGEAVTAIHDYVIENPGIATSLFTELGGNVPQSYMNQTWEYFIEEHRDWYDGLSQEQKDIFHRNINPTGDFGG